MIPSNDFLGIDSLLVESHLCKVWAFFVGFLVEFPLFFFREFFCSSLCSWALVCKVCLSSIQWQQHPRRPVCRARSSEHCLPLFCADWLRCPWLVVLASSYGASHLLADSVCWSGPPSAAAAVRQCSPCPALCLAVACCRDLSSPCFVSLSAGEQFLRWCVCDFLAYF